MGGNPKLQMLNSDAKPERGTREPRDAPWGGRGPAYRDAGVRSTRVTDPPYRGTSLIRNTYPPRNPMEP